MPPVTMLSLDGEWTVREARGGDEMAALVPGCVHADLLRAGAIEDPYYRENELDVQWVGERDWLYAREFEVPAGLLEHDRVLMRCEGLDTLAEITVNDMPVGSTDNMFRTWELDVADALRPGPNRIEVLFRSVLPVMKRRNAERKLRTVGSKPWEPEGRSYVRKQQCNFGWDWGPVLVTCGIWRSIELLAFDAARLDNVYVQQSHQADAVDLCLQIATEGSAEGLRARARIQCDGRVVDETSGAVGELGLRVEDPRLWWPNGMGEQPLYTVTVELLDAAGEPLDTWTRRIGLRRLELVREEDTWGQSFHFRANGVPFFAKGANWIPADAVLARVDREHYSDLLKSAADANMNMMRVWGGGVYEHDAFYELCDEMGLCVWQDFMFACNAYPADDPEFLDSVRAEAEDNVRRLRHHACLALWCGNNELEMHVACDEGWPRMPWEHYKALFDELLPEVTGRLDPQTPYWPCSPHTPGENREEHNDPTRGDAHLWSVWHGRQPFEWYRTSFHRFCSEFGFQSFPEPVSVERFTEPGDRNLTSPVMEHHQRSWVGNAAIMHYMLSWFRMPVGWENTVWLSQIQQGVAIKYAVEHWRRNMPRCMGAVYWQLNDCWPVASWASLDYYGRWKALQYLARRFFEPVLVSGVEDAEEGTVEVHVSSDRQDGFSGEVRWVLTDQAGAELESGTLAAEVGAGTTTRVDTLDLALHVEARRGRNLLLWLDLLEDGELVSENLVTFGPPKTIDLEEPCLATEVARRDDGSYLLTLTAERPALWAWVELADSEARAADNFLHVRPGRPARIALPAEAGADATEVQQRLIVRSLRDTY